MPRNLSIPQALAGAALLATTACRQGPNPSQITVAPFGDEFVASVDGVRYVGHETVLVALDAESAEQAVVTPDVAAELDMGAQFYTLGAEKIEDAIDDPTPADGDLSLNVYNGAQFVPCSELTFAEGYSLQGGEVTSCAIVPPVESAGEDASDPQSFVVSIGGEYVPHPSHKDKPKKKTYATPFSMPGDHADVALGEEAEDTTENGDSEGGDDTADSGSAEASMADPAVLALVEEILANQGIDQ